MAGPIRPWLLASDATWRETGGERRMRSIVLVFTIIVFAPCDAEVRAGVPGSASGSREIECEADPEFETRLVALVRTGRRAVAEADHPTARRCGQELLRIVERCPASPHDGYALHEVHRFLGHVALAAGDVAAAKRHLIDAGRTHGSPSLRSFGPRLDLARALLARGERDAVIEYLRSCSRFWKGRKATLERWIADIQSGGQPHLKDFAPPDDPPR